MGTRLCKQRPARRGAAIPGARWEFREAGASTRDSTECRMHPAGQAAPEHAARSSWRRYQRPLVGTNPADRDVDHPGRFIATHAGFHLQRQRDYPEVRALALESHAILVGENPEEDANGPSGF